MLPKSAADIERKTESGDILIIVKGESFYLSISEALSLAGTITALVSGKLKNGS